MRRQKNTKQESIFIKFMKQHGDISSSIFNKEDQGNAKKLWHKLTKELNANGPPIKNVFEWKKVWADWKQNIRRKLEPHTGEIKLTINEQSIVELCDMHTVCENEFIGDDDDDDSDNKALLTPSKSSLSLTVDDFSTRRHKNLYQDKIFIDFMKKHKNFANGNLNEESEVEFWQELVDELNSYGPPKKSADEWKKIWNDWKTYVQSKFQDHKNNGHLSEHEEIIAKLCNFDRFEAVNVAQSNYSDTYADESMGSSELLTTLNNTAEQNLTKRRYKNPEQSKTMIKFMQEHKNIANFCGNQGDRLNYEKLWHQLTTELNAKGPPEKTIFEWKNIWGDWKRNCLRKLKRPTNKVCLSDSDRIIIELCSLKTPQNNEYFSEEDSDKNFLNTTTWNSEFNTTNTQENVSDLKRTCDKINLISVPQSTTIVQDYAENVTRKFYTETFEEQNKEELYNENILVTGTPTSSKSDVSFEATTPTWGNIEHTLSDLSENVTTIKLALEQLRNLMVAQNEELRRHHLVMEQAMKNSNMTK